MHSLFSYFRTFSFQHLCSSLLAQNAENIKNRQSVTYTPLSCQRSYIVAVDMPDTCVSSTCPSHNCHHIYTRSVHCEWCCDGRTLRTQTSFTLTYRVNYYFL